MEDKINLAEEPAAWYVLRVTYQRELMAKKVLDELHIVNFLPTEKVRRKTPQGRFVTLVQPAVHNYIFVYATRKVVDELKQFKLNFLRYVMTVKDGLRCVQTVPEDQMKNFIAIAGNESEKAEFLLDMEDIDFNSGDKVRVIGGPFEGVEGIYMRTSHTRSKRVVVQVGGLMAVATTTLPLSMVEKI